MRTIMLIDMDYFFVACEEIKRPELKNLPTIVGADPKEGRGRGVVMTCNYLARKYGIHSAMPISQAYKIKPDAIYLPMDYAYYESKSKEVIEILRTFSTKLEQVSIDEAYLDMSGKVDTYSLALEHAEEIKNVIREKAKLPCSIGISSNKLIAKMACEAAKPNGIKLVAADDAKAFLENIPVGELYGVGRKTRERLEQMGYNTIGKLARSNMMVLRDAFGSFGIELHNYANGIDESPIVENYEVKSIGREVTFEYDTNKAEKVIKAIRDLSREVFNEISNLGFSFKVVTLKIRYSDFSEHMKSRSIKTSNKFDDIEDASIALYKKYVEPDRRIRKIGVRVSHLTKYKSQKRLF